MLTPLSRLQRQSTAMLRKKKNFCSLLNPLLIHFFPHLSQSLRHHRLLSLQGFPKGNSHHSLKLQPGERGFRKTSAQAPRDRAASPGDLGAEEGGGNRHQNPIPASNYHCYKHKEMGLGKHVVWDSIEAALIHAFSSPMGSLAEENRVIFPSPPNSPLKLG